MITTCFLIVLANTSCAMQREGTAAPSKPKNISPELTVKQRLQQSVSGAEQRTVKPFRTLDNRQGGIVFPGGLSYSNSGDLYISDNNGQKIQHWAIDASEARVLPAATGAGKLKFPNQIQAETGRIFVVDNDGIKTFSTEGQFEGLLRSYLSVSSFAITGKDTVLANPVVRDSDSNDPLIVEIDKTGKNVRGFGVRRNVAGHQGLEDIVHLSLSEKLLFAAFKHHPTVEIYDINSGKLVQTLKIDHQVFRDLESELKKEIPPESLQQGRLSIPRYLAGIKVLQNRVYLCLYLPEPEIWEFDHNGNRLADFRISGLPPAVNVFGFDVRVDKGDLLVAVGTIDQGWNTTVSETRISSHLTGATP